jgi:DNA-binding MarR family transcriptional regulator
MAIWPMLVMGVLIRSSCLSVSFSLAKEMDSIANDTGSGKPLDDAELVDVATRLHSAAIHLLRRVRRVDEETGVSAARLSALSVLVFGGERTLGALARSEQVSAATMSRLVTALERKGLVAREAHATDRRAVVVRATAEGRRVLERGRERRVAELVGLLRELRPAERELLRSAAEIVERLSALPPSAAGAYAAATAERRWSGLSDDSSGSGGTSG